MACGGGGRCWMICEEGAVDSLRIPGGVVQVSPPARPSWRPAPAASASAAVTSPCLAIRLRFRTPTKQMDDAMEYFV